MFFRPIISVLCVPLFLSLSPAQANEPASLFKEVSATQVDKALTVLSPEPDKYAPYQLFVRSEAIEPLLNNQYTSAQLDELMLNTKETRKLSLTEKSWGTFIQAASFEEESMGAETHYDAIWLRDSLWGYLALNAQQERKGEAKKVLLTLWDYMSSPAQIARMDRIIADPSVLQGPDGQMQAIHIRFDSNSRQFEDVKENGKPQQWNHKQNDALGLFLDLIMRGIRSGELTSADWQKPARLDAIIKLVAYFDQSEYYLMEDSGAWEEIERLNTSSVALVTSGLEQLNAVLSDKNNSQSATFTQGLRQRAEKLKLGEYTTEKNVQVLISRGYTRISYQLSLGGESPDYGKNTPRYRTADAALLNLIYPARLAGLTIGQKAKVLSIVRSLAGDYGIKRYEGDTYQSGNFWFNDIKTDTSDSSHRKRESTYIPFTEAQWFFDSWYALCASMLYKETGDKQFESQAIQFMNRSLAQITGKNMKNAKGAVVPANALPESTNVVVYENRVQPVPSPITPLNWAKASMTLMFSTIKEMTAVKQPDVTK